MDNENNANVNSENSGRRNHYYGGKHRHNYHNNRPREAASEGENGVQTAKPNEQNQNREHVRRFDRKPREVETTEDIKKDIMRIEKELWLEISEISAIKLGV